MNRYIKTQRDTLLTLSAATVVAGATTVSTTRPEGFDEVEYYLDVTTFANPGTFDCKVQVSPDPDTVADASALWIDYPSGGFTQLAATGSQRLAFSSVIGARIRLNYTIVGATAAVTGTVKAVWKRVA